MTASSYVIPKRAMQQQIDYSRQAVPIRKPGSDSRTSSIPSVPVDSSEEHMKLALELRSQKLLPPYCQHIPLKMPYLRAILEGKKTIEGRINSGFMTNIRSNDHVMFFSGDKCCLVKVSQKDTYRTFREMLSSHGVHSCLPGFHEGLDGAVRLYRSFPGYTEKEERYGVLALTIKTVSCEAMKRSLEERRFVTSSSVSNASTYNPAADPSSSSNKKRRRDDEDDENNAYHQYDNNRGAKKLQVAVHSSSLSNFSEDRNQQEEENKQSKKRSRADDTSSSSH